MRPFQPVSPLDNSGQIPFGLPMVSTATPHHQIDHSFHQYTVAGDGRPMTVGQYLDYVLQQQADQVNAFKNDITDAVHGMRQDINELIDLVKRLDTIKNKKGIKDDKKGLEDDKKGIE
jgi:hypothetical protein